MRILSMPEENKTYTIPEPILKTNRNTLSEILYRISGTTGVRLFF